jgi:protein TonB
MEVLLVTRTPLRAHATDGVTWRARAQRAGNTTLNVTETPSSIAAAGAACTDAVDAAAAHRRPAGGAALTSSASDADIRYYASPSDTTTAQALAASARAPRSGRGKGDELVLRGVLRADLWLSPDTRASKLAPYLDRWRRKVERIGTLNYPVAARRVGLSGSPVIEVAIRSDGRLLESTVRRTSGFAELDQAALGILRLASPFDPFPAELAAEHGASGSPTVEFTDGGSAGARCGRAATRCRSLEQGPGRPHTSIQCRIPTPWPTTC